jgi:hypothetical protein
MDVSGFFFNLLLSRVDLSLNYGLFEWTSGFVIDYNFCFVFIFYSGRN